MEKHTCKHCNCIFEYCRGCLLSPIPHKDAGFCSKECYEASKNKVVPEVIEIISVGEIQPITEEVSIGVETETIIEEATPVEVETEVETSIEVPIETTTVAETTFKNETNTYKKKRNKYKYTSSY